MVDEPDAASISVGANTEEAELFWGRALKGRRKRDIVSLNQSGAWIPLFLFPSVALGPTEYSELGKSLDPEQPWHVLIPPVKQFKAGPEGLIQEIALYFADRLEEIRPAGPFVVGGWSAGVTPALALARHLLARGREVPLLIAIDMAPENTGVVEGRKSLLSRLKTDIHNSRQQGKDRAATSIEFAKAIFSHTVDQIQGRKLDHVEKLKRSNPGMSPDDVAQMRRFYAACFACSPPGSYDGNVLVIEASHDRHNRVGTKWKSFAPGAEIVVVEGSHLSIVYWKAAAKLGEVLNHRLRALSLSGRGS